MPQNDSNTSSELVALDVPGVEAPIYVTDDEFIVLRHACEVIGIDADAQQAKLKTKMWATTSFKDVVAADGKIRSMTVIDRRTFLMWLATLDENRVSDEARPIVIAYQAKAADVLDAYFSRRDIESTTAVDVEVIRELIAQSAAVIEQNGALIAQNGEMQRALIEIATAKAARVSQIAVSPLVPERLTTVAAKPVLEADVPTGELIDYSLYTASGWLREVMGMDTVNWEYKKALGARAGKLARMRRLALVETAQSHFGKANKWPGWLWNDAYAEVGSVDAYVHELESRRQ